jgi:hypothetical protein
VSAQKKPKLEVRAVTAFRMKPSIKKALAKAAATEKRTPSSLAEAILEAWLTENGFLK